MNIQYTCIIYIVFSIGYYVRGCLKEKTTFLYEYFKVQIISSPYLIITLPCPLGKYFFRVARQLRGWGAGH